jgi:hypothetical protein
MQEVGLVEATDGIEAVAWQEQAGAGNRIDRLGLATRHRGLQLDASQGRPAPGEPLQSG